MSELRSPLASSVCTIIVTYNAMEWIDRCLGSLERSELKTDLIVIDNKSNDITVAHVQDNYPQVKLFINDNNLGFGGANNQGLVYAYSQGYDFFFLLNQDAWVDENTVGNLKKIMDDDKGYGITSPIHLSSNRSKFDDLFYEFVSDDVEDVFLNQVEGQLEVKEVHFVNAAAWMISKECLEKVGIFHPLFFHYGEDLNYVQRVRYEGLRVGLVNQTYVVHDRDDRPPSKIKFDPFKRLERDLFLKLLEPNNSYGWIRYARYLSKRLKFISKDLSSREEVEALRKFALDNFRVTYLKARKFDLRKLSINSSGE
ncbi:MAG: family 2 glycosyl transferase [Rickettsiales bacterium]|nr:family 2 glycosyl transferase [Rickettsiales bacterium]